MQMIGDPRAGRASEIRSRIEADVNDQSFAARAASRLTQKMQAGVPVRFVDT